MSDYLSAAARDALEWLQLFAAGNAIGKLGRGQREAALMENQARLERAIAALEQALETENRRERFREPLGEPEEDE